MARHGRLDGAALVGHAAPPDGGTDTWLGDSGAGGNGDWNTAADWSPSGVPGTLDTAVFATGNFGYTVTGDATIGAIQVNGDGVTFDGTITEATGGAASFLTVTNDGQVTLDANSFVTGQGLSLADGTLLDVQGILITTGGTADVVIDEGLNGQLIDSGTLDVNQLYVQTGASFAGSVALNDGGSITVDSSSSFGGGSVTLLGSALVYAAAAPGNTGGDVGIGDSFAFTAANTYLNLAADPGVTLAVSGPITGDGSLLVTGGTVELTGANSYTGFTGVENGTLQIDTPGAVPSNLVFLQNGGFINEAANSVLIPAYADTVIASGSSDTVDALGGGLLVFAGPAGTLSFVGGATGSTVIGGSGILSATGGSAGDLIFGGTGTQDTLSSGTGNSTLVGGAGADLVGNGAGDAVLIAGGANTMFNATEDTGSVTLFGAAGANDTIFGGAGSLVAIVNNSDSTIYGGSGAATVFGGSGALDLDYVNGGAGGTTDVAGFNTASDAITLVGYASGEAANVLANETISGGSTYLQLSDNTQIVLFGVTNLTSANFVTIG